MEWITDKKPEDMYTIDSDNSVDAVLIYMPMKVFCGMGVINDEAREMALVKRMYGVLSNQYHWIINDNSPIYNRVIHDMQAVAWCPIPKYEEGGNDDLQ